MQRVNELNWAQRPSGKWMFIHRVWMQSLWTFRKKSEHFWETYKAKMHQTTVKEGLGSLESPVKAGSSGERLGLKV